MGKRSKRSIDIEPIATAAPSPFAQLKSLRGQLPEGVTEDVDCSEQNKAVPAFANKVVVRKERSGRGGKTVTIVSGVLLRDAELSGFTRRMRSSLGTGARIEDECIVLNGNLVERVANWLEGEGAHHVVKGN